MSGWNQPLYGLTSIVGRVLRPWEKCSAVQSWAAIRMLTVPERVHLKDGLCVCSSAASWPSAVVVAHAAGWF